MVNHFQAFQSHVKKILILFIFLSPVTVFAEEGKKDDTNTSEPVKADNSDLIKYLEEKEQKEELKRKEKLKIEEEEKLALEKEEEKEKDFRSSFVGSSNTIQGFANKYGYYFTGYTRNVNQYTYHSYGYFFTDFTKFEKNGNYIKFKNGKGKFVHCSDNSCEVTNLTDGFKIPNWQDIKSNIYEVDYPAYENLDKSYLHHFDFYTKVIAAFISLFLLIIFNKWLMFNRN